LGSEDDETLNTSSIPPRRFARGPGRLSASSHALERAAEIFGTQAGTLASVTAGDDGSSALRRAARLQLDAIGLI
jgi:hypothetical protein